MRTMSNLSQYVAGWMFGKYFDLTPPREPNRFTEKMEILVSNFDDFDGTDEIEISGEAVPFQRQVGHLGNVRG